MLELNVHHAMIMLNKMCYFIIYLIALNDEFKVALDMVMNAYGHSTWEMAAEGLGIQG